MCCGYDLRMAQEDLEATQLLEESGQRTPQGMDETEVQGVVSSLIQNSIDYIDEAESPVRESHQVFPGGTLWRRGAGTFPGCDPGCP